MIGDDLGIPNLPAMGCAAARSRTSHLWRRRGFTAGGEAGERLLHQCELIDSRVLLHVVLLAGGIAGSTNCLRMVAIPHAGNGERSMVREGGQTIAEICKSFTVSRATLYRAVG